MFLFLNLNRVYGVLQVVLQKVRIGVQRDVDGIVTHELLDRLDVDSGTDQVACEAVAELVVVGFLPDLARLWPRRPSGRGIDVVLLANVPCAIIVASASPGVPNSACRRSDTGTVASLPPLPTSVILPSSMSFHLRSRAFEVAEPGKSHQRPEFSVLRCRCRRQDHVYFIDGPEALFVDCLASVCARIRTGCLRSCKSCAKTRTWLLQA